MSGFFPHNLANLEGRFIKRRRATMGVGIILDNSGTYGLVGDTQFLDRETDRLVGLFQRHEQERAAYWMERTQSAHSHVVIEPALRLSLIAFRAALSGRFSVLQVLCYCVAYL
jgi:hypothetical protein